MNLPNKLTLLRICLVPFFVFFILAEGIPYRFLFALIIFSVASYTDHLDGKIARRDNLITNFGKLMDPLADKIMVMAALICFVKVDLASAVFVIIILFREFGITSIRLLAVEQGRVIAANNWGKAKTVSQIVAIIVVLFAQFVAELVNISSFTSSVNVIGQIFILVCTVLTIISGVIYVKDNLDVIREPKEL